MNCRVNHTCWVVLACLETVLFVAGVGYGYQRYTRFRRERQPPQPQRTPLHIGPLYNQPSVVNDEQLSRILHKLRPSFRGPKPKINYVDHALRFWGVEASFESDDTYSGHELRELLLDHRVFAEAWGPKAKPFLLPETRDQQSLLAFRTKAGQASASHVDHTLAGLAEVGTPIDFPVITPQGEMPLQAAFEQSLREFSLNQEEYEWSTLVYLHYLPQVKGWYTQEGQLVTWDRLAERLMRQRLALGVCFGQHRLHTLTMLLRADETHGLLTEAMRNHVKRHLQDATQRLVHTQHAEGYWDASWPGTEWDGEPFKSNNPLGPQADRLLVTGHVLEWWALAPADCLPEIDVVQRAAQWLVREIDTLLPAQVQRYYPFLTHAGRALALWRGVWPHQVSLPSDKRSSHELDDSPLSALTPVNAVPPLANAPH
ncbi:MAG: hypothetical protein KatS3mg113_0944 [Planctomycetaceae bacterium]|nr:MAG: hypothetical protein KatS3mg113_0944 [Planctomycetaceae bacterium]